MFFHRVKLSYDNILRKPSNAGVLILVFDSPRAVRSCEIVFGAIVYPHVGTHAKNHKGCCQIGVAAPVTCRYTVW